MASPTLLYAWVAHGNLGISPPRKCRADAAAAARSITISQLSHRPAERLRITVDDLDSDLRPERDSNARPPA
jgi:hypothetical protein